MSYQTEIRQRVTDLILTALESGRTPPWRRPWAALLDPGLPANVVSRQSYRGINPLVLTLAGVANGWAERWWGTFNQWRELGCKVLPRPAHVRPGEWGVKVVYCRPVERTRQTDDGEQQERYWVLKEYTVFHLRQVVGPAAVKLITHPTTDRRFADYSLAERVIGAAGVPIRHGGNRAAYNMTGDCIVLPPRPAFKTAGDYYGTVMHELAHATGHPARLDRLTKNSRFGDQQYAFEELVAEIAGAYTCSELGVPDMGDLSNTTAYLASWLKVLRCDPSAVFKACSQASAAADYLLARPSLSEEDAAPALAA